MAETNPNITEQSLAQAIKKIVDEGDLSALTFNMIFQTLESQYKTNLDEKKVHCS
jgi:hypothetical protein